MTSKIDLIEQPCTWRLPFGTGLTAHHLHTLYGLTTTHHSVRVGLYHCREQLHTIQESVFFQDSIHPHLSPPLLSLVLRIRTLVKHAREDITHALVQVEAIGQLSPRTFKGKGRSTPPTLPRPTDDPIAAVPQPELMYLHATSPTHHHPTHAPTDHHQPPHPSTQILTTPQTAPLPFLPRQIPLLTSSSPNWILTPQTTHL